MKKKIVKKILKRKNRREKVNFKALGGGKMKGLVNRVRQRYVSEDFIG